MLETQGLADEVDGKEPARDRQFRVSPPVGGGPRYSPAAAVERVQHLWMPCATG